MAKKKDAYNQVVEIMEALEIPTFKMEESDDFFRVMKVESPESKALMTAMDAEAMIRFKDRYQACFGGQAQREDLTTLILPLSKRMDQRMRSIG